MFSAIQGLRIEVNAPTDHNSETTAPEAPFGAHVLEDFLLDHITSATALVLPIAQLIRRAAIAVCPCSSTAPTPRA